MIQTQKTKTKQKKLPYCTPKKSEGTKTSALFLLWDQSQSLPFRKNLRFSLAPALLRWASHCHSWPPALAPRSRGSRDPWPVTYGAIDFVWAALLRRLKRNLTQKQRFLEASKGYSCGTVRGWFASILLQNVLRFGWGTQQEVTMQYTSSWFEGFMIDAHMNLPVPGVQS